METGVELIAAERSEQIEKHGFDVANDKYYALEELRRAAIFSLTLDHSKWPRNWDGHFKNKIFNKTYKERMIVAGALIAAEIDRINNLK